MKLMQIHPLDNIAVALTDLASGTSGAAEDIPAGHKMALRPIASGESIIKYGCVIGKATKDISAGCLVHTHNVTTTLSSYSEYTYHPVTYPLPSAEYHEFRGYLRPDGRCGIRNELWIIPTVGCVNGICKALASAGQELVQGNIDGVYAFPHPFGCSQMGNDHAQTRRILAALAQHPNAGGVLIVGLGCENLTIEEFKQELGDFDPHRIRFLLCQQESDEIAAGMELLRQLSIYANCFGRQTLSAAKLVVGLKCGGSDGLSGITANPTVGCLSDNLVALGASTILTEVPEMFGAESILLNRCLDISTFEAAKKMLTDFKDYFTSHHQVVYENPSPGNKKGGISTLEDKSCGCVQKGGRSPIAGVLEYGQRLQGTGLHLLSAPGNDLVSTTALTAAGAHLILFTTGRGTPFGAPAPTLKISSNTTLYQQKPNWIDFDAGTIAQGKDSLESAAKRLLHLVLEVASGKKVCAEKAGNREISIFKDGVVM